MVAVFVTVPVVPAVVIRVIVTLAPFAMVPIWQLSIVPPVQVPCDDTEET